jgi:hypothetical protein
MICRLRWHLHELDTAWEPKARSLDAQRALDEVRGHLQDHSGVVARLAVKLTERCAQLTITIKALEKEITELTTQLAGAGARRAGDGQQAGHAPGPESHRTEKRDLAIGIPALDSAA